MDSNIPTFSKILFSLTIGFLITAAVLFIIASFAVGTDVSFLNANAFKSMTFWVLTIFCAMWYHYRFGTKIATSDKETGEKTVAVLFSVFIPLLVGMGMALVGYYLFYGLALLVMVSLGYIVIAALVIGMLFAVRFLINLYFKPTAETGHHRAWMIPLSLLASIALLTAALWISCWSPAGQ